MFTVASYPHDQHLMQPSVIPTTSFSPAPPEVIISGKNTPIFDRFQSSGTAVSTKTGSPSTAISVSTNQQSTDAIHNVKTEVRLRTVLRP